MTKIPIFQQCITQEGKYGQDVLRVSTALKGINGIIGYPYQVVLHVPWVLLHQVVQDLLVYPFHHLDQMYDYLHLLGTLVVLRVRDDHLDPVDLDLLFHPRLHKTGYTNQVNRLFKKVNILPRTYLNIWVESRNADEMFDLS